MRHSHRLEVTARSLLSGARDKPSDGLRGVGAAAGARWRCEDALETAENYTLDCVVGRLADALLVRDTLALPRSRGQSKLH